MNQLQYYSSNGNIKGFFEKITQMMEHPHSQNTHEQLRNFLTALIPFYIFDEVYTEQHTQLIELLQTQISVGNLNLSRITGSGTDMQRFFQTLVNTTNIKAFEVLHPLAQTIQMCHTFPQSDAFMQQMGAQLAQLQHDRITQTLIDSTPSSSKRKM